MNDFLNLPGWKTISVDGGGDGQYHVHAEPVNSSAICPRCANFTGQRKFGTFSQVFLDLPAHAKKVGIYVNRQRYQCLKCQKTYSQKLVGISENHNATARLIDYIGKESLSKTFTELARETGYTVRQIKILFHEYEAIQTKKFHFETPEILGIDEIYLRGKYYGVMANVGERTIFDMLADRNKSTIKARLMNLKDYKKIKLVAMDMWEPYRDAVAESLPGIPVVIDKFHVERGAGEALDTIRKKLRKDLSEWQRRRLKGDKHLLLSRSFQLTKKESTTLKAYLDSYAILKAGYEAKEGFFDIYSAKSEAAARKLYDVWLESLADDIRYAFADLITLMTNWDEEIFNYFNHTGVTNAYTESLNGLIKIMNRTGRGYSFDVLRTKMIFSLNLHKQKTIGFDRDGLREKFRDTMARVEFPKTQNFGADISTLIREIENGRI